MRGTDTEDKEGVVNPSMVESGSQSISTVLPLKIIV